MRRSAWLLWGCAIPFAGLAGCNGSSPATPPPSSQSVPDPAPAALTDGLLPETAVARFRVEVDPGKLSATVTPVEVRTAQNQPPQAISYDLDIENFLTRSSLNFSSIGRDVDGNLELTFTHAHPFPAPDFTRPISGTNRADLGYTGRLVILADATSQSFFGGQTLDPTLVTDADGYVDTGDLLARTGLSNNTFPFVLLADDGEDNRVGVSNGGGPQGNYDPATGWQRSNIGSSNTGWTGFDYVHGGQTVSNSFTLRSSAISGGSFTFEAAILIKYTDPRGAGGKTLRFPPATPDVTQFAYRLPFAALDASKVTNETAEQVGTATGSTGAVHFEVRDWDAGATEAADADLSNETDVMLIQPGASGAPAAEVDAPFLSASPTPILPGGGFSGLPGNEIPYDGSLTNSLGTATAGDHYALIRLTDPENGDPAASGYHFGVDPNTITPDASRALEVIAYQVLPVNVGLSLSPPEISQVSPTGVAGCQGVSVSFSATATNSPTSWNWNFGGGATPNTSTDASPMVTLAGPGTYNGTVTATNAAGSSAPFPFSFTVDAPWAFHDFDLDAAQIRGYQGTATIYDGKPALVAYEMVTGTTTYTYNLRVSLGTVANPTSAAQWNSHQVFQFFPPASASVNASYANIVVVNNRLAVIFYDAQALQLKIAVANSPAPFAPASAADWTIHAIDPQSCAFHNNATMHNGQLVVTYRVTSGSDLKVARAIVPVPTSTADWNLHLADTGTPAVGLYSAPMSYDDGSGARLVVVHRDSTNQTIKYGKANVVTPASAADWTFHVADAPPGGVPGLYLRIKNFTVSGSPRVAFVGIDASATVPTYSVYTSNVSNPANTADWTKVNLGTPPAGGGGSVFGGDVNVYNGKLVVVWTRVPAANQWEAAMARANVENPTSLADWSISTVDSTINQGIYYTGLFPYALVLPNNDFVVAHRNMGPYVATGSAWRWERRLCPLP